MKPLLPGATGPDGANTTAALRTSGSSLAGATTRTRRWWPSPAPRADSTPAKTLVFGSSAMANASTTLIASSLSFAVSAERRARRRIFLGSFCS